MKTTLRKPAAACFAAFAALAAGAQDYPPPYIESGTAAIAAPEGPRDESNPFVRIAAPEGPCDVTKPFIRMAVSQFALPNAMYPIVDATIVELKKVFGAGNFEAFLFNGEPENFAGADLVLGSAGVYMRTQGKGARAIATAVSDRTPDPNHGEGSLFVTLKSRTDIDSFEDLRGKRAAATVPAAFGGRACALGEIARRGADPDSFFSEITYTGLGMTRILRMLRAGQADVGIVRTCFLEELAAAGADTSDIKPVAVREGGHPAGCLSSTSLYPNWTISATPGLEPELARQVSLALLSMPAGENGVRWSIASDFSEVDSLFRLIREGPYEHLRRWTAQRVWEEYGEWITLGLFLVIALITHSLRSSYLVRVRTRQLSEALDEQRTARKKAAVAQERMMALQRAGATGQMSSIIAHELRQPLSTIIGYAHGIGRLTENPETADLEMIGQGADIIREQALKAETIVRKVRDYARGRGSARSEVRACDAVRAAAATVRNADISETEIRESYPAASPVIWADPMEIELAVQNLIRNALQALEGRTDRRVLVSVTAGNDSDGSPSAVISVSDNGRALTGEEFARLSGLLQSDKTEGLGLGLSIVRLIAESHSGHLEFEQLPEGGLKATIRLPLYEGGGTAAA